MDRRSVLCAIGTSALLLVANISYSADPTITTITVKGMQCAACASHVSEHLQAIPGVAKAQADAAKAVALVTAKGNANPSPRAMWEAVEKAGYTPVKLVSPSDTFTSKPKS